MTPEQRYDLAIEWRLTSNQLKQHIREEYLHRFGHEGIAQEHWEEYLVDALNIRPLWQAAGLLE